VAIEQVTNGAVTRKDLRPDDWHLIWPELVDVNERAAASDDVQPPVGKAGRKKGG
jgi:DNA-binding transcriptional regulator YdaS (Cro superfamily)